MNMALKENIRLRYSERKIYWDGIFAGTLVALVVGSLLSLLGAGLGATTLTIDEATIAGMTIKSGLWFIMSGIVSMFFGGWTAAHFSHFDTKCNGFLQGFLTYCLATFISFISLTTAFALFINGAFSILDTSLRSVNSMLGNMTKVAGESSSFESSMRNLTEKISPDLSSLIDNTKGKIKDFLHETKISEEINQKNLSIDEVATKLGNAFTQLARAATTNDQNEAREKFIATVSDTTGMGREEAQQQVEKWEKQYNEKKEMLGEKAEETKEQTKQIVNNAINSMGNIALVNFMILVLGAIAAGLGGMVGIKQESE